MTTIEEILPVLVLLSSVVFILSCSAWIIIDGIDRRTQAKELEERRKQREQEVRERIERSRKEMRARWDFIGEKAKNEYRNIQ